MYLKVIKEVFDILKAIGREESRVKIVAVSKNQSIDAIQSIYDMGCRDFGESRVQELLVKEGLLPKDINWHMIGTLQKNKVAKVIEKCSLIHSVDSYELAEKIAVKAHKKEAILLQVNTSFEDSKHGLYQEEWEEIIDQLLTISSIQIKGLMTIGPLHGGKEATRACFKRLREFQEKLQKKYQDPLLFSELSMGMSGDFQIALEEGATILRIGSLIF